MFNCHQEMSFDPKEFLSKRKERRNDAILVRGNVGEGYTGETPSIRRRMPVGGEEVPSVQGVESVMRRMSVDGEEVPYVQGHEPATRRMSFDGEEVPSVQGDESVMRRMSVDGEELPYVQGHEPATRRMSVDGEEVPSVQGHESAMQNSPTWPYCLSPNESMRIPPTRTMYYPPSRRETMRKSLTPAVKEPPLRTRREIIWQNLKQLAWNNYYMKLSRKSDTSLKAAMENQLRLNNMPDASPKRRKRGHNLVEKELFLSHRHDQSTPVKTLEFHITDCRQLPTTDNGSRCNDSQEAEICRPVTPIVSHDINDHMQAEVCTANEQNHRLSDVGSPQDHQSCSNSVESTPVVNLSGAVPDMDAVDDTVGDETAMDTAQNSLVLSVCGGDDNMDKDKYWEEERRIFCERMDIFLALVGPILGDRRFSRWKGSVVDSVVGVYITQNCADSMSSSAFMTLAASFPLGSKDNNSEPDAGKTIRSTEEQNILELEQEQEQVQEQVHDAEIPVGSQKEPSRRKKVTPKRDWDNLRKQVCPDGVRKERSGDTMDSVDWEAVRSADVKVIADALKERGMNNVLAERIQEFLNRIVEDHGSIDLEWLRDVPPKDAKDFFLDIRGLGLKSAECVRLLTLEHVAFPVDVNVNRIFARLGWIPLLPLPVELEFHDLKLYPATNSMQEHIWPRLCKLDHRKLYELHYHLITFGKVFCTKKQPNCDACPMKGECKHFKSACASARRALGGPEPALDIEDALIGCGGPDEIPALDLVPLAVQKDSQEYDVGDLSQALVSIDIGAASIPKPKPKKVAHRRTLHQAYQLPDDHQLSSELGPREPEDPCPYFLAIWPEDPVIGGNAGSTQLPQLCYDSQDSRRQCDQNTSSGSSSSQESEARTVKGTILIPCRTAMRGRFPLNGTYFQVREVFADYETSLSPMDVPIEWLDNLPRRSVYCGTSVSSIAKGLTMEDIRYCFHEGYICLRGFDRKSGIPSPLHDRLHLAPKNKRKSGKPLADSDGEDE